MKKESLTALLFNCLCYKVVYQLIYVRAYYRSDKVNGDQNEEEPCKITHFEVAFLDVIKNYDIKDCREEVDLKRNRRYPGKDLFKDLTLNVNIIKKKEEGNRAYRNGDAVVSAVNHSQDIPVKVASGRIDI